MKVKVVVTLDVNSRDWQDVYDVPVEEVRADVQEWAKHLLYGALRDNGLAVD